MGKKLSTFVSAHLGPRTDSGYVLVNFTCTTIYLCVQIEHFNNKKIQPNPSKQIFDIGLPGERVI